MWKVLRALVAQGGTVVLITHKLDEVLQIADRAVVMRTGRVVEEFQRCDFSATAIARAMVGREVHAVSRVARSEVDATIHGASAPALRVQDLVVEREAFVDRGAHDTEVAPGLARAVLAVLDPCLPLDQLAHHLSRAPLFMVLPVFLLVILAEALAMIAALYRHEQIIREQNLDREHKLAYRTQHSEPIVDRFWHWCDDQCHRMDLLPSNPLAKAIQSDDFKDFATRVLVVPAYLPGPDYQKVVDDERAVFVKIVPKLSLGTN